jgi:hypothetical protein
MKYTLFLGIEFQAYNKPVDLEIRVGGRFIDTFSIQKNLSSKNFTFKLTDKEKSMLGKMRENVVDRHRSEHHWGLDPDWIEQEVTLPTFYKIYELDDSHINGSVEIHVTNSSNNYTNGFMTKDSKVRVTIASILPSHLLEDEGHKLISTAIKLLKGVGKHERRHGAIVPYELPQVNLPEILKEFYNSPDNPVYKVKHYEKGLDQILTEEKRSSQTDYYGRHCWPLAHLFYVKLESEEHEKNGVRDHRWWIGGNCTIIFPIRQKHKTKYIGSWAQKEIGFIFATRPMNALLTACKHLINIYNEDQRSYNR